MSKFRNYLFTYLAMAVVFLLADLTWLGILAHDFYWNEMGPLVRESVIWPAAALFYLIFLIGVLIFVVIPSINGRTTAHTALFGALFGMVTYATFDLTALALIEGFPMSIVPVDLAWGMTVTALVSATGHSVAGWLAKKTG